MEKISLDFEKGNGLIPVVIQDYESNEVLMFAYMSQESFNLTLKNNKTWFYSRSRNELWNKGATSGNFQEVKEIWADDKEKLHVSNEKELVILEIKAVFLGG